MRLDKIDLAKADERIRNMDALSVIDFMCTCRENIALAKRLIKSGRVADRWGVPLDKCLAIFRHSLETATRRYAELVEQSPIPADNPFHPDKPITSIPDSEWDEVISAAPRPILAIAKKLLLDNISVCTQAVSEGVECDTHGVPFSECIAVFKEVLRKVESKMGETGE